eukprot:g4271.t1
MEIGAKLVRCFVLDRSMSCEDDGASEEERAADILYFYPSIPAVNQIRHVSLCAGLIDFSRGLDSSDDDVCHTVEMMDELWVFRNPEPQIWFVLVASLPRRLNAKEAASLATEATSSRKRLAREGGGGGERSNNRGKIARRPGKPCKSALSGSVLHSVLEEMHNAFVLFHGSIRRSISTKETKKMSLLRKKIRKAKIIRDGLAGKHVTSTPERMSKAKELPELEKQLAKVKNVSTAKRVRHRLRAALTAYLRFGVKFDHLHLFDSMRGFRYMAVDKVTYLNSQYFLNLTMSKFAPQLLNVAFLFDGRVMSTDIEPRLMRVIHNVLQRRSFRDAIDKAQRMSLPFVLAPDGSIFARAVYDVVVDRDEESKSSRKARRERDGDDKNNMRIESSGNGDATSSVVDMSRSPPPSPRTKRAVATELSRLADLARSEWALGTGVHRSGLGSIPASSGGASVVGALEHERDDDNGLEKISVSFSKMSSSSSSKEETESVRRLETSEVEMSSRPSPLGRMMIFQHDRVVLILIVSVDALPHARQKSAKMPPFCERFVREMKPEVRMLAKVIARKYDAIKQQLEKQGKSSPRYIYFNRMNYSLKTAGLETHASSRASTTPRADGVKEMPPTASDLAQSVPKDLLPCLDETHTALSDDSCAREREIYVKVPSRKWVVGRKSSDREFLVMLNKTVETPRDAEDAWREIQNASFRKIFA